MLGACGDDDDPTLAPVASDGTVAVGTLAAVPNATTVPIPSETASAQVKVTATDYRFDGLPSSTVTGTQFSFQNDSTKEVHEMIVQRIPDEETRPVGALLALPEDELEAAVGNSEPVMVIVALPGEAGMVVEGTDVINEPGRYAVLCFIPVGADPEKVREAMSDPDATGPPDLGTGPPHIMEGMYGEVTVE